MSHTPKATSARPQGFLRSGGWILVVASAATAGAVLWTVSRWLDTHERAIGDGRNVSSYGFSLEPCLVPADTLVASGMSKDGLHALREPAAWKLVTLDAFNSRRRGKLLVSSDRVVGVTLGDQARAYPLRFLAWHEVVNDVLGGVPIAVTYHALCDSAVVLRREIAAEVLEFGVSGLLSNSNLLLYDRRPDTADESLWGQLELRAVAGPAAAAGRLLEALPAAVTPWGVWRAEHPTTTLLAPEERMIAEYRRAPYSSYFGSDLLRFPVRPLPPFAGLPRKTPIVVALIAGTYHAFLSPSRPGQGDVDGRTVEIEGTPLRFRRDRRSGATWLDCDDPTAPPVVHAFLFAWYAAHPGDTVWHGLPGES